MEKKYFQLNSDLKLFKILRTFNPREFKNFGKFLNSPFFNESKKLISYYNFLKQYYPLFDINIHSLIKYFTKIYTNEEFNRKKLGDLSYQLDKLAEDYLGYLHISKESLDFKRYSLVQISKRKLESHFNSKSREIEKLLNQIIFKDNAYFFKLYLLKREKRFFYETSKPLGKRYKYFEELGNEIEIYILYFVSRILKYYCIILRHEKEINYKFVSPTIDYVTGYVKDKGYFNYPVLQIFYNLILLLRNMGGKKIYSETKDLLLKHSDSLDASDKMLAWKELFYYSQNISESDNFYRRENFLIIQEMLNRNLFPEEENRMSTHAFIYFVKAGLRQNKIRWTENFINKYKEQLTKINKTNTHLYCEALILFHKNNYIQSTNLLSKITPKDFYFHIFKKILQCKIYFESGDYDSVFLILKSLNALIKYDAAIPAETILRIKNFIKILNQLTRAKINNDKLNIDMLKSTFNKLHEIEEKDWISSVLTL